MKKAFTMIELIFVIVIIGILAAVALPKMGSSLDNARLYKAQEEVSNIQSGIANTLNDLLMEGNNTCPDLEKDINDENVFENVLQKPIPKSKNNILWNTDDGENYKLTIDKEETTFNYDKNTSKGCPFECNKDDNLCKKITGS